ncbi:DUF3857 domain-containing protein [Occallatibacter riparius]|uniref:DUF3857 and transglutaminase domain-containing protein n=1 Tax=Occallatibacter riparius TaxID=1002689 RepID=A0A9J7BTJ5_9BACT|nr:DUF3857 domain-containing protein [Occallatibacter riparius]UWZ84317.1 DUF3857 and transglutaminase domain-containing protein [Occallatibacter riparius]
MTSDPKAPGAAAVYLYVEEKTDDAVHYHSYYARIKVLTDKGTKLATVHVPYEKGAFSVAAIHGRTIHADGTIIPLQAKPSDLLSYKGGGHQYNEMVFTLPAVEVGSILEYYLQLRYSEDTVSSPEWRVQQQYFVHKAHYFFNPVYNVGQDVVDKHGQVAGGLVWATRLSGGGQVVQDSLHRYKLDVTDVPPMPTGDYLPPLNNLRDSVIFFYTSSHSGEEFWSSEGKYWAKNAERFAATSGAIKKAVADLVAVGDSDEAKARKLYAAVMKIDNSDFSGATGPKGKGSKDAASVWKQQRGTSDEITLLYVALARAAGLKAWPMQVVNRDRAAFEPTNLSVDQFDDYIAIVELGGKEVYLDPGQKMCGYGILHWKHEMTKGFRLSEKGISIEDTPAGPAKAASVQRLGDVNIDEKGAVTGTVRFVFGGLEALRWRQLALIEPKEELSRDLSDYLDESLPDGVKGDLDRFEGLSEVEGELTAYIKLSGSLGATTAKRMIVPAFFFEARGKHPFVDDDGTRRVPIDLHYATLEQDDLTYKLPAGMKMGSLPRNDNIAWAGQLGLTVAVKESDGAVNVKRKFVRAAAMFEAGMYGNLQYIYKRISNSDQQQIVLERQTETAAN